MASWLVVMAIALIVAGLGSVVVLQFVTPQTWRSPEGLFASIALGVVLGGWLALVLAEMSQFSRGTLLILWLAVFLVLLAAAAVRRSRTPAHYLAAAADDQVVSSRPGAGESYFWFLLLLWLVAAVWLFFRPHEYILGGADAGVYVSIGAEIAQNGGFDLLDETFAQLDPAVKDIFTRPLTTNPVAASYLFPGFYVIDPAAGTIAPQFYPLHPVWQAVAFSLSSTVGAGVHAELLISGLWMALASVAIILTARELGGWLAAIPVMAALSVTALQVWFARYPTTEALTQFLLWSGLWASIRWLGGNKPASLWAFVSGSALGAVFLVRIDILVLLPIFVFLIVGLWLRGWRTSDWWFVVPFSLLAAHSFMHGAVFSAPYFSEHLGFGLRLLWVNWWIIAAGTAAGILALWLLARSRAHYGEFLRYRRLFLLLSIGGFLLYAIYGWFIRPVIVESTLRPDLYSESLLLISNHENWRRLGWYLSTPGIWLAVGGISLLIWRVNQKTAVLVATGILFSVIYLWNVRANPHQIYVMRRYVPVVAPFFLLAGAYLLSQLPAAGGRLYQNKGNGRTAGAVIGIIGGVLWIALLGWSARGFIRQVDYRGVVTQLELINEDFPPNSVLLFNDQSPVGEGDFWGTPLKYIFGHDVFKIRDLDLLHDAPLAETIEFWQNNGRPVIWFGDPGWLYEQGFEYHSTTYTIASRQMESSYEHKPQQVNPVAWRLEASFVEPDHRSDG